MRTVWTSGSTLYFCPGLWSSFPSRHLWGFPEEGTTGQHPPCCEWQFPQSAKGSRCKAGQKATKQHSSVVPEHSSGLPAQVRDTRTTEHHLQCFRLKHSFLALLSTVWFPEAHEGLMVTILWSLKLLEDQLQPSPFTTREGFLRATVADAVLSRKGRYVIGWQRSNPVSTGKVHTSLLVLGALPPEQQLSRDS